VPYFICPRCKERSVDIDALEGFSEAAPACRHCGFGFLFELLDDYYPAPATGFVVCDQEGRVLAIGRGVFELTGFQERELMGRSVVDALSLSDAKPVELVREWGVRRLGEKLSIRTRAGSPKNVTADFFPAYDSDGGLLVALTPR
jgi:PAS domain-containing protein